MMLRWVGYGLFWAALSAADVSARPVRTVRTEPVVADQAGAQAFISDMAQRHQFDADALQRLFREARVKSAILQAMERPAESKPWYVYRGLFVEPKRIAAGVRFWDAHAETLARAEARFGVPAELIVAIIGVETFYGRNTGNFRVLDALSTLAFAYPKRADYFRNELEQYLLLTREGGIDPLTIKGSYAGAMGIGQFMPSSYRQYGVDFDGDGQRDLWRNAQDAIGSVAQYLQGYGWQRGAPVLAQVQTVGAVGQGLANRGWAFRVPTKLWSTLDVVTAAPQDDRPSMLFALAGETAPEYWLGYENFYVITRYNRSYHYSMAVWELGQAIAAERAGR